MHDWANWKRENGEAFAQLKSVLRELSPDPKVPMEPGELIRSSRQHTHDYPTLKSPSGQIVPRIHCVYSWFKLEDKSFPGGNRHGGQVDHFMPRASSAAKLAYEWENLRWAWGKIDSDYKGNNVIPREHDPVNIKKDSAILDEDDNGDLVVIPNPHLQEAEKARLKETIRMLGLNRKPIMLARNKCFDDFIDPTNSYDPAFMEEMQPFVYRQMIAQSVDSRS